MYGGSRIHAWRGSDSGIRMSGTCNCTRYKNTSSPCNFYCSGRNTIACKTFFRKPGKVIKTQQPGIKRRLTLQTWVGTKSSTATMLRQCRELLRYIITSAQDNTEKFRLNLSGKWFWPTCISPITTGLDKDFSLLSDFSSIRCGSAWRQKNVTISARLSSQCCWCVIAASPNSETELLNGQRFA